MENSHHLSGRSSSLDAWHTSGDTYHHPVDGNNTMPIFYQRQGDGPTLLSLHGFPTSSWDFRDLWPELIKRFDVIAHDFVGMGYSAKPARPLTLALQADVVEGLLQHLGVDSCHILAHDLGDTLAQELLARSMDGTCNVQWLSCVFLNGGLFPESHQPRLIQKLLLSPLGPLVARLTSQSRFHRSLSAVFGPDTQPSKQFLDDAWMLLTRDGGRAMLPRLIRYMHERKVHRRRWVEPLIQNVVPMRLIDGALDPVSGRHLAERYAELVPEADVVMLDHLGHYPHVEEPGAVLGPFLDFMETRAQPTARNAP